MLPGDQEFPEPWLGPTLERAFPGGSAVKNQPASARDTGSIPGLRRCPGEVNGNPLQYSCLGNPMVREAGWATVHRVTKSRKRLSTHTCTHAR